MNEHPTENFSRGLSGGLSGYSRSRDRNGVESEYCFGNLIKLKLF